MGLNPMIFVATVERREGKAVGHRSLKLLTNQSNRRVGCVMCDRWSRPGTKLHATIALFCEHFNE